MSRATTRGTTPYWRFKAPFDLTAATEITLTIVQNNEIVIQKFKKDMVIDEKKFYVHLTQDETKRFSTIGDVEIQCVPEFPPGEDGIPAILASQIIKISVRRMLQLLGENLNGGEKMLLREVNDD